jgi:hypothetical protein
MRERSFVLVKTKTTFGALPCRSYFTVENDWNQRWFKDSPATATDFKRGKTFRLEQPVEVEKLPKETDYHP